MRSASTSARLSERIRRRLGGKLLCVSDSVQDGTCFKNYNVGLVKETTCAASLHSEGSRSCNDTSGKSARLSLRASNTSSSSELEHSKPTSGTMERSARDLARIDLELLLNLVRGHFTNFFSAQNHETCAVPTPVDRFKLRREKDGQKEAPIFTRPEKRPETSIGRARGRAAREADRVREALPSASA